MRPIREKKLSAFSVSAHLLGVPFVQPCLTAPPARSEHAAAVPPESPVQASRFSSGLLPGSGPICELYPPVRKVPPAVMMSLNAPPLMLISKTNPSKFCSVLNRFLKLTLDTPLGTTMFADVTSDTGYSGRGLYTLALLSAAAPNRRLSGGDHRVPAAVR